MIWRSCFPLAFFSLCIYQAPVRASFVNWETTPVHPLEMTPDGSKLLATNTADARLEIFSLGGGGPVAIGSVHVGLDPVSVRARTNTEAWVANTISDSISIVDLTTMNVIRTISTGDEPADVVFAGTPQRAFVTIAGRNQINVYDPANLAAVPLVIDVQGHQPRALATGNGRVYAAIFFAGNRSTVLSEAAISAADSPYAGVNPPPNSNNSFSPPLTPGLPTPPKVGMIVNLEATMNGERWKDDNQHLWDSKVTWGLNQNAIAIIDANTLATSYAKNMGNLQMSITVQPSTGKVFVGQLYLRNEARFESVARAQFARQRVGIVDPVTATVSGLADINTHLFANPPIPIYKNSVTPAEQHMSMADLRGLVWNIAGTSLYVSGMDSNNIAKLSISGSTMTRQATIDVGQGPAGLAYDGPRNRLYCLNHFDSTISIINTTSDLEILPRVSFYDPTPQAIKLGRPVFYGSHTTSLLGQASCASCHVDGKTDMQPWDLGNPAGSMKIFNQTCNAGLPLSGTCSDWHPMKGPLLTQTLADIIGNEPFHRRGDREDLAAFSVGFTGLLGNAAPPSPTEMQQMTDFIATIKSPPQPNRTMTDNVPVSLAAYPQGHPDVGEALFNGPPVGGAPVACTGCHSLPTGGGPTIISGNNIGQTQGFKAPELRDLYGRTGFSKTSLTNSRGFGYGHDGASDSIPAFLQNHVGNVSTQDRLDLEAYLVCFPTAMHPAVGVQITFNGGNNNDPAALSVFSTMLSLADSGVVGVIAKGRMNNAARGYAYLNGTSSFQSDRRGEVVNAQSFQQSANAGGEITFTVVPSGTQTRMGIDRDDDGYYDLDETQCGGNPLNAAVVPIAKGDIDGNGVRNTSDIAPLITILLNPGSATTLQFCAADVNSDLMLDGADIAGFCSCLLGGPCP
jgi:YVTN family beta-propeller protein